MTETLEDYQTLSQTRQTRGYKRLQPQATPQTSQVHKESNTLSLHQVAPLWASVLARMPKTDKIRFKTRGMQLDISQMKMCVVGEAHGFQDKYDSCDDCYKTSLEFATLLRDSPYKRKAQLDQFVAHFNSKHL